MKLLCTVNSTCKSLKLHNFKLCALKTSQELLLRLATHSTLFKIKQKHFQMLLKSIIYIELYILNHSFTWKFTTLYNSSVTIYI